MTKEQEDKIIEQASEILWRRSVNTIHFEETGGGGGEVSIDVFIVLPNKKMAHYDNNGELSCYTRGGFGGAKSFQVEELPKEFVFSFRHGMNNVRVDEKLSGYKWTFEDLRYKAIDENKWKEERQNIKIAIKQVAQCKTIGDVYAIYDKYLRTAHIPYEVIWKAFEISGYEPSLSTWARGEIGAFASELYFAFLDIMNDYEYQILTHTHETE